MLINKAKDQKEFMNKLKNEIDSFLINYQKRYDLFPWKSLNKVSNNKSIKDEIIKVNNIEFTISDLIKRINEINSKLKSQLKKSHYNYIINGFIKETSKKERKVVELVYNDYSNQLKLKFKDMQSDLLFCIDGLKEINKFLKEKNKIVKESANLSADKNERKETSEMLGYVTTESNTELDLRDFYLECFNDIMFDEAEFVESTNEAYDKFAKAQDTVKEHVKCYRKDIKEDNFKAAREDIINIRTEMKVLSKEANKLPNESTDAKMVLKAVNVLIKTMVVVIPNSGSVSNTISILKKEKDKNDSAKDESAIVSQIKSSIEMINKVCDMMDKDLKEKEVEFKKNEKAVKESSEYEEMKLSVYRACQNGEITLEEREDILSTLMDNKIIQESEEVEMEAISDKERYDRIVKSLYERCHNGEFDIDQREILIEKAQEMIFNKNSNKEKDEVDEEVQINDDAATKVSGDECDSAATELNTASDDFAKGLKNINIKTE